MRIGIDIRNIGKKRTGDEVVFFNLVKNLAEIDRQNDYLLFTDTADNAALKHVSSALGLSKASNFKIIALKTLNRFIWNLWTLPRYLRKDPVDVYHTQYITPFFVPKKINIVATIHDISFNFFPQLIKFSDRLFLKILIPLSLKRADKIIGVSEFTCQELIKFYGIDPEKVECVLNAADDFPNESPDSSQLQRANDRYGLPERFILYMGTMQPRKNLPVLVEAYGKFRQRFPGVGLVLAGKKNARNFDKNIDAAIRKFSLSNDVVFPGYVDSSDKFAVFRLAEAFCLPSLYEGFGIPILEAMAAQIPAVVSDIPAHREVAGEGAMYFKPKDSDDLAQKLSEIVSNAELRNDLIRSGSAQARKFSWKDSAAKMLKIYKKLHAVPL